MAGGGGFEGGVGARVREYKMALIKRSLHCSEAQVLTRSMPRMVRLHGGVEKTGFLRHSRVKLQVHKVYLT